MLRHDRIVVVFSVSLFLLHAHAFSQTDPARLKYGESMPSLAGQALSGKWIDLPRATHGNPAAVIFSFSRAAGRDSQNWTQHLSKDDPLLTLYTVIFLESVPRLLRSMVATGIQREMPAAMQDRTILLYRDEPAWKQRLQMTDESHACVTLVGPDGEVQWITSESFTEARYSELKKHIPVSK
ncbi:MAG: hypothetical protein WBX22_32695 [Silvibacterium sp.]